MNGCERCEESASIIEAWGVSDSGDEINMTVDLIKEGLISTRVGLGLGRDGNRYHNSFMGRVEINYCPFCGRKLK
jgi:hypothetical protein